MPRRFLALALTLAACGGGTPGDDTTDDDTPGDVDAPPSGTSGLTLTWESRPTIPGEVDHDLTVTWMNYHLVDLRAVGDAATLDLASIFDAHWTGAGDEPATLATDDAPAGVYSQLAASIAQFEIRGQSGSGPYILRDTSTPFALHVALGTGVTLQPGVMATVRVRVRVEKMIEDIDFAALPLVDGVRTLGPGDAQLAGLRAAIAENITVSTD